MKLKLTAVLISIVLLASTLVILPASTAEDPIVTEPPKALGIPTPMDPVDILLDAASVDEYVQKNKPEAPPFQIHTPRPLSTRGAHVEPDDQGPSYNNNISSAELLEDGDSHDATDGDNAPYLNCSWGPDLESPGGWHWWAGIDVYKVYLTEPHPTSPGDFVNITITVDYGTNHSGNYSWDAMGMDIGLYDQNLNMLGERGVRRADGTIYLQDWYTNWRDSYGSWYTCFNFIPFYTGFYYLYITPTNWTDTYGSGAGMTAYPNETRLWYNISCEVQSDLNGYPAECFNPGRTSFYTGATDGLGGTPTFDTNVRMEHAFNLTSSDIPRNVEWVHGLNDMNDWFNMSDMLLDDPGNVIAEDVNISFEMYSDNYQYLNYGGGNWVVLWAMTTFTCWFRNSTTGTYYGVQEWGHSSLSFWDSGTSSTYKQDKPYMKFKVNASTDRLYAHVSTDMIFICPNWLSAWGYTPGVTYPASALFDYLAPYAYYNISQVMIFQEDPRPPEITNATVDPASGLKEEIFNYKFTYVDHNGFMPTHLRMVLDQGTATPQFFNILTHWNAFELDPFDDDTFDGKTYGFLYDYADLPAGNHTFLIEYSDGRGMYETAKFDGPFIHDNLPPYVKMNGQDARVYPEDSGEHTIMMEDIFDDPNDLFTDLTFAVKDHTDVWGTVYGPNVVTIDINQYEAKLTTVQDQSGELNISFRATDPKGEYVVAYVPIIITPVADIPVITNVTWSNKVYEVTNHMTDVYATESRQLNLTINVFDPDPGEVLTFSVTDETTLSNESNLQIDGDGNVTFTPTNADVGARILQVKVKDSTGNEDWVRIAVHVNNVPDVPVLTVTGEHEVYQYETLNLTLFAFDPDPSDTVTFATNVSTVFSDVGGVLKGEHWGLDQSTGEFYFIPENQDLIGTQDSKTYWIGFTAVDSFGEMDTVTWKVTVKNTNDAPTTTGDISAKTTDLDPTEPGEQNLEWYFSHPGAEDIDGDSLVYIWDFGDGSIPSSGMDVNHTFPAEDSYQVTLVISDGNGGNVTLDTLVWVYDYVPATDGTDGQDGTDGNSTDGNETEEPRENKDNSMMWVALAVIALFLILIVVIVVVIIVIRSRKDEEEEEEEGEMYMDDVEIVAPTGGKTKKWWEESRDADVTEDAPKDKRRKIVHVRSDEIDMVEADGVDPHDVEDGPEEEQEFQDIPVEDIEDDDYDEDDIPDDPIDRNYNVEDTEEIDYETPKDISGIEDDEDLGFDEEDYEREEKPKPKKKSAKKKKKR